MNKIDKLGAKIISIENEIEMMGEIISSPRTTRKATALAKKLTLERKVELVELKNKMKQEQNNVINR